MLPYITGVVAITQGSDALVGTGSEFLINVRPGDLFTIDHSIFYPIKTVVDNTHITLTRNYAGGSISAQAYSVYRISSNWGMNSTIEAQLVALIDDFQTRLDENWKGIKGDKGDVALTVKGIYAAAKTYVPGDIVAAGVGIYLCVLQATGQDPTAANSAYWKAFVINSYNTQEGDPA